MTVTVYFRKTTKRNGGDWVATVLHPGVLSETFVLTADNEAEARAEAAARFPA